VPFQHRFRVRYVDGDAQKVMHNAQYLAYIDDAVDTWLRAALGTFEETAGFDVMLKRATVEWHAPARVGDHVDCSCAVTRWGHTSFDVEVIGTIGGAPCFTAQLVQVSTEPGAPRPVPIPEAVRAALGGPDAPAAR
jgi:acyl-CoA thioester hydrolase